MARHQSPERASAADKGSRGLGLLTSSGSLFAGALAFFAASCCVLPLIFVILGVGGAWLSVFDVFLGYRIEAVEMGALTVLAGWAVHVLLYWRRRRIAGDAARTLRGLSKTGGFRALVVATALVFGAWLINTYQGELTRSLFELRAWLNE